MTVLGSISELFLNYVWCFKKYMLDFLQFLVNLYFIGQNHHGQKCLKNTLRITFKLTAPHFGDLLHSYLICTLSRLESNRKKNDNYQISFLHMKFEDHNFQNFCYVCALKYPPYLSKYFPDCWKTNFESFLCIRTSMKLNNSYEAMKSYKFLSNFRFTYQDLYRPELQKSLPNVFFQVASLYIDDISPQTCYVHSSNLKQ